MYSLRLRTIHEELNGMPWTWVLVSGIYALVTVVIPITLVFLVNSIILKLVFLVMAGSAILVFILKLRTAELQEKTYRMIMYRIKTHKNETIIPKHTVPLQFLKGIVPIETSHEGGLIEFTNKRYGIIYRLFVPSRTDKDLDSFIQLVTKNIVDRLYDGHVLNVFEMQRYTVDNSIINQVAEAMNDDSKTSEQREHLNSIYQQLKSNSDVPTNRYIYASIFLGRFDEIKNAYSELDNITLSIEDGFKIACIGFDRLEDYDEISKAYRRCMK